MASQAAETVGLDPSLKGRTFRCAVQGLYFRHSEWASAHEDPALAVLPEPVQPYRRNRKIIAALAAEGRSIPQLEASLEEQN